MCCRKHYLKSAIATNLGMAIALQQINKTDKKMITSQMKNWLKRVRALKSNKTKKRK